jgi:diguanylate cyclase (GGDEF)-like protein
MDAFVDPLTGVASRGGLERCLSVEWQKAKRNGGSLGLLILDLDELEGDHTLREVANTIAGNVRETDLVARFDGNEFVVVSPETSGNGLRQLAGKLTSSLAEQGYETSIGRAELELGDRSPADVVARADVAMHQQKERKRTVRQGERRRRQTARGRAAARSPQT